MKLNDLTPDVIEAVMDCWNGPTLSLTASIPGFDRLPEHIIGAAGHRMSILKATLEDLQAFRDLGARVDDYLNRVELHLNG